ncbi:hypothetical protein LXT12_26675, partial [Pelomonas sp. P7]
AGHAAQRVDGGAFGDAQRVADGLRDAELVVGEGGGVVGAVGAGVEGAVGVVGLGEFQDAELAVGGEPPQGVVVVVDDGVAVGDDGVA